MKKWKMKNETKSNIHNSDIKYKSKKGILY